jgi:hypothetical protein
MDTTNHDNLGRDKEGVRAWLGCPFCGEQPEVTKHFKHDTWNLIHRCKVFTTVSIGWTTLESLQKRWNTRQQPNDKPSGPAGNVNQ